MDLKDVKMIDILLKLKYRKASENAIVTTNGNFTIIIDYNKIGDSTEINIYESLSNNIPNLVDDDNIEISLETVHYQYIDGGNLIPIFTVVSDEDYIRNRLKVDI